MEQQVQGSDKVKQLEKLLEEQGHEIKRLEYIVSENEKKMRQVEEEKAKKDSEIETQKVQISSLQQEVRALKESIQKKTQPEEKILELAQLLGQEKESHAELQKKSSETQKQFQEEKKESTVDETGNILSNSEKEAIVKDIRVEYKDQNLSIATISQICDATLKFAVPGFIRLTNTERQERRALKNDLKKYTELWDTYAQQMQDIIEKSQDQVLRVLNISDSVWENSNRFYVQSGNQEAFMIKASLPQKLKTSLGGNDKPLDSDKYKQVLRTQVEFLEKEAENVDEIKQYVTYQGQVVPIIQSRVDDKIFEIYGVEEEHIDGSMSAHMMDPEVQQIFMQLEEAKMRLLLPEL